MNRKLSNGYTVREWAEMSTNERIASCSPNIRPYFENLRAALADAIVIPNNLLPPHLQQEKTFDVGFIGRDEDFTPESLDDLTDEEYWKTGLADKVFGRTIAEIERLS